MGERENAGNIVMNGKDHFWVRRGCELTVWSEQGKEMRGKKDFAYKIGYPIHEARCLCK